MNAMELLTGPFAQALGWALLHLVWQATIVAGILAAVLALIPRRSASVRYAVACGALALVFALFVTTAIRNYDSNATPIRIAPATASMPEGERVAIPITRLPIVIATTAAASWRDRALDSVATARQSLPTVVAVWLMGVIFLSGRLLLSWLRARSLVNHGSTEASIEWQRVAARISHALGLTRAVRILESAAVEVPSVLGSFRPVILLPASTLTGLTPAQLEMVLAHELAHIRRHDFLINLMQAFVETLMFYHPAVWWMSRRVRIERENCCDDLAVAVCGDALQYAKALTRLEELRADAFTIAVAANGGSLLDRIRRIAGGRPESTGLSSRWFAAVVMLVILAFAFAFPSAPALAQRKAEEEKAKAAASKIDVVENNDEDEDEENGSVDTAVDVEVEVDPDQGTDIDVDVDVDPAYDFDFDFEAVPPIPPTPLTPMIEPAPAVPPVPPVPSVVVAGFHGDFDFDSDDDDDDDRERHRDRDRKLSDDGKFTVDELISLRAVGVTPAYIKEMRAIFPGLSLREVTSMRAVGVDAADIRAYRAAGIEVDDAGDATSLRAVGVTPGFVEQMRAAGFTIDTAREATSLRAVGVTPEYVREMRDAGFTIRTAKEATSLRAVGVTADFVQGMRTAGFEIKSAKDATSLRAVGVTPEYVREMRATGLDVASAASATSLRAVGVTPEYVREMRDAGFQIRDAKDATSLRAVGVTAEYVKQMRDAGVDIRSAKDVTSMRAVGVTPELVARLAAAGYTNLSVRELTRLAAHGFDEDFIREMNQYRESSKDKNKNK